MKWSKYNYSLDNGDGKKVLFNCKTKAAIIIVPELVDVLGAEDLCAVDCNALSDIHPSLYRSLEDRGFIVDEEIDEFGEAVRYIKEGYRHSNQFEIIVNPTMDCNLRCWYCYEKHLSGSMMDSTVLNALSSLAESKLKDPRIDRLTLSFFGGEPLVGFRQCIEPLISFLKRKIGQYPGKTIELGFTTNGCLMTRDVTDFLVATGFSISCQVPFDGGRELHDKTKVDADGNGTFDIVVENIKYALSQGITFVIRCNYTEANIRSFHEVADIMAPLAKKYPGHLLFSLQKVWQQKGSQNLDNEVDALEKKLSTLAIDNSDGRGYQGGACYADIPNSLVVNYDGNIFKCTARQFLPSHREGVLNKDGSISLLPQYFERMEARFINKACRECRIFPLCECCTQKRLERKTRDECVYSYGEGEKEEIVRSAVKKMFSKKT